ncbi:MAG: recombination mediator RecR [Elusimicrobiota bacterium]
MYRYPQPVEKLVNNLSRLPGIGPKTAQRLAFYILKTPLEEAKELSEAIRRSRENISPCKKCGNYTDKDICNICSNPDRNSSVICVVENPQDVVAMESSGEYKGLYHVIMGSLSPLDGVEPEDLKISQLIDRITKNEDIEEIILATDPDVEGEATAEYIKEELKSYDVKVTHLALGIPMGGNLEYADGVTLSKALEGRREY